MLKITAEQMDQLTQKMFFGRLIRFIFDNCKNEKLRTMAERRSELDATWLPAWPRASKLSEHDCALFLVMLAVCKCEGISPPEIDGMVDHVGENEVRIKMFISERGYFRFSDFDYPGGGPEEESHG